MAVAARSTLAALVGAATMLVGLPAPHGQAGHQPPTIVYSNGFETPADLFGIFEEPIDECYDTGIGAVTLTDEARTGAMALSVESNAAGKAGVNNHVLANFKLWSHGTDASVAYEAAVMLPGEYAGTTQTSAEMSVQNTRRTPSGTRTSIMAVQHVVHDFLPPEQPRWQIWTDTGGGKVGWVPIPGLFDELPVDAFSTVRLEGSFTSNRYGSLTVEGPGVDFDVDLSDYVIVEEDRQFEPAVELTLEAEALWQPCDDPSRDPEVFQTRVVYDDVKLEVLHRPDTVGLVDPDTGRWHLRNVAGEDATSFFFGNPGDVPFAGDWDCDGVATPGLFRQSDAFAYLSNANRSQIADIRFFFGNPSDIPLAGDFDGDGCDTLSLYRPSEQRFFIVNELGKDDGGLGAAEFAFGFGDPDDKPVVGDWDGDGIDEVGLHRESAGFLYWRDTLDSGIADGSMFFGDPNDRFVAGDWLGEGDGDTPGVFRPSMRTTYLRYSLDPGAADGVLRFGEAGWLPVAGSFGIG